MGTRRKSNDGAEAADTHLGDLGTGDGYIGEKVDPRPNSDHSLESGPDGVPPLVGQREGRAAADRIGDAADRDKDPADADGGDENIRG